MAASRVAARPTTATATAIDTGAYLRRIGYDGPTEPTVETLRGLQWAHLLNVPFENLDIALGRPIRIETDALFAKIVRRRRGGFCYELNGLFAVLLENLGYRVTRVSAQWANDDGTLSQIFDHLALLVEPVDSLDRWLIDVGAGSGAPAAPLRLVTGDEQAVPRTNLGYRFDTDGDFWRLHRHDDDGWSHQYSFTLIPRQPADFADRCRYQQTDPNSHFTQGRICSLATPDGRVTISRDRLILTKHGQREEREPRDEAEARDVLKEYFGIDDL